MLERSHFPYFQGYFRKKILLNHFSNITIKNNPKFPKHFPQTLQSDCLPQHSVRVGTCHSLDQAAACWLSIKIVT